MGQMSTHSRMSPPTADPWATETVAIEGITQEVSGVATYALAFRDPPATEYRFAPGQFNMLYLPGAGEIAISVSGDPAQRETVPHTIRIAGNVTRTLANLPVGSTLGLRGPFGTPWPMAEAIGRDVILVAGGIGLAPLRPVIYALLRQRRQFGRLHLLYGARSPDTLLYHDQYAKWAAQGLQIETTVDRSSVGWLGNVGVVTMLLDGFGPLDAPNTLVLCCGPEVMMRFALQAAINRGVAAEQIWVSLERNMQCAVGHCGHCQLGPEFVCKDGPVFRYDRVADYLVVEGL